MARSARRRRSPVVDITFVGTGPYLRLVEVLAVAGARVTVVGNRQNSLRRSRFVDQFVELDYADTAGLAPALLAAPALLTRAAGWVVVADDATLRHLAGSDLPLADKHRILPARTAEGLDLLGSKVGLERLQRLAGSRGPRTAIVDEPAGLAAAVAELASAGVRAMLVKGDGGGGGDQVRSWGIDDDSAVPRSWYPLVVQERVAGVEISVEALFRDGLLVGWLYAQVLAASPEGGPSVSRRYGPPACRDFLDDLARLGSAGGLHGFFHASLIWSPREERHYLFELDGRPNAWAQFGPALGVDWVRQLVGTGPDTAEAAFPGGRTQVVHLYPRELIAGLDDRDWARIRPWVLGARGTWGARNVRDRAVNAADRSDLWSAARHWAWLSLLIGASRTRRRVRARRCSGRAGGRCGA